MASRRMFSLRIINSARFLKMPISSQALYFHLGLHADDDGIVEAYPVLTTVGCSEDDLKVLVSKGFVQVLNEDLVTFITDWKENNVIRADRKVDSIYQDLLLSMIPTVEILEKKQRADVRKKIVDSPRTDNGRTMDGIGKDRIGKDRIGKDRIGKDSIESIPDVPSDTSKESKHKFGEYKHVLLKDKELESLKKDFGEQMTLDCIKYLDEYIEMKGTKYKSHYLAIRKWVVDAVKERQRKAQGQKVNSKFNNYEHREYDFDAIERQLLGNTGGR